MVSSPFSHAFSSIAPQAQDASPEAEPGASLTASADLRLESGPRGRVTHRRAKPGSLAPIHPKRLRAVLALTLHVRRQKEGPRRQARALQHEPRDMGTVWRLIRHAGDGD